MKLLILLPLAAGLSFAQMRVKQQADRVSVTSVSLVVTFGFLVSCVIYVLSSLSIACYLPELFPTEVRLRGSGIANTAGRAVNIAVPYAIAATFDEFGLYGVLALISAALLLQMVMLATMGIETKQRSLEELSGQTA